MVENDEDYNSGDKVPTVAKRICLGFQSQDRHVRKQCYKHLHNLLKNKELTNEDLKNVYCETHMYFINGLRDKTETVREEAIKFVTYLVAERLPLNDFYLTYIVPVILERIGTVELVEESEEIRLQMLQLLEIIIKRYTNTPQLKPFLNDAVLILSEIVKDKYPAIKELACKTVVELAKALPRDFHMQAESLLQPVLTCFSHQRYKVRVEAIKAVGEIIMHSSYNGIDQVVVPMAEKLFDQIPIVRQTVAQEAARWLLQQRDRYSFFHKMLPLLLTGLNDEVESTRIEAHKLWEMVGLQYQQENEKDLKDKMDYLYEVPDYYPKHLNRPNLGCRVLVQRNVSKIAGGLVNELTSWQEDIRVRCSQLLCSLVLHAEEDITFSLQTLLPPMYSAARDDDERVVANIIQASQIVGLFVDVKTWSKLVLPVIEDGPHYGHLIVLTGLIGGARTETICSLVSKICQILAEDHICCSRKKQYQLELLRCIKILMQKYTSSPEDNAGYNFFKIITTLISLKDPENVDINLQLYEDLATLLDLANKADLFCRYMNPLLLHINKSLKCWTAITDNACIFLTLISESNDAFATNQEILGDMLHEVLDSESDAELRLKVFYTLATLFDHKRDIFRNSDGFFENLIGDVFVPSLVWHAGFTAESIRTMAATCLKYLLMPADSVKLFSSRQGIRSLMDKLIPLLLSLVEDASYRSRQVAIECLTLLKEISAKEDLWLNDDLLRIYPEVLKRLDDPTEKVRTCALQNLPRLFNDPPQEFLLPNFKAHRELIIDTLLTHFDDDEEMVQALVFVLKVVGHMSKSELIKKIEVHRPLLRNQKGCKDIIEFVETL
ncbi:dynein axonemal assembly factor 5 isoform X2 [Cylas formicarius]|uniref:dynein axonemal assembly factor 5 isoform X2 n=1 Tax=Cylas formicarius TaxID=197179 RepID=UPI00295871AB|nr:dynein axonemal assembly factor 5 isoform X2 [Cylas formicarius]